jgi:RND family efflux transporter MFP subunit
MKGKFNRSNKMIRFFERYLLIAIVGFALIGCSSNETSSNENTEKIPVEITTVELGNLIQSLSYNGDIEAEYEVKVFSKVPDRIEKFYADEGDFLRKGNPVAKVVATTIEQSVRQAEAALIAAKAQEANLKVEYERAKRLHSENAMSKQQYEATQTQYEAITAQVEQTEAALASARSQLDDALVSAPISGIIGKRYYDEGDMANPAQPLVSIVQMNRVKITFDVTEVDLGKIKIGQAAIVRVKSYPDRQFKGKVIKVSPVLDPLTRMAEVEVLIDNPNHILKPGMFAQVEVTTGVIENTIIIPRFATIENTTLENIEGDERVIKNYYVFVVDSNKAEQRKLDVRYANHINLAINSGIEVGEKLVTLGHNLLRDGSPVMVVNENSQPSEEGGNKQ